MSFYDQTRQYYVDLWPAVRDAETWQWACPPNAIEWEMSPFERIVWGLIRDEGLVMYPQHPCAGFFVDFGHPKARIAIECDGRRYHKEPAKDRVRQEAIEAKGWRVYRLKWESCGQRWADKEDPETGDLIEQVTPALQLIRDIGVMHRLSAKLMGQEARRAA